IKIMFDEVKKIQTEKIDPKTLELQIRKFTSSWYLSREQASSQSSIFALYQTIGAGWQYSNTFIDRLNKVTPDQMMEVSKKYLTGFTYGVVGPEPVSLAGLPGVVAPTKTPAAATAAIPKQESKKTSHKK
ncbi:MAG: putative Zn-dependent peptidase, partial [Bacteriovoracaceae bacterium]|nr:putative Zn-dependent peptidase [Bacteriovoracaceae bacterium]